MLVVECGERVIYAPRTLGEKAFNDRDQNPLAGRRFGGCSAPTGTGLGRTTYHFTFDTRLEL